MKLVIYRTFDVFAATPLPTTFLHPSPCDNMNPYQYEHFSHPSFLGQSPVAALAKKERDEIV